MTIGLQLGDRTITGEEIIPLLASYKILPQLLCESIIDQAIANHSCTPEETTSACQQFYEQWGLTNDAQRQAWMARYGMNQEHLKLLATRSLRVAKFKQATWGHRLESYFLQRKGQLDRVVYSLIRTHDKCIANELYFRIKEGEQTFAELARQYSEGSEAQMGGLIGPVELGTLPPNLAQMLYTSQPGQLWEPLPFGEGMAIVRLEKIIPVQLNESIRQRLLNEQFEAWFQEQLKQLPHTDRLWMGAATHR